MENFDTIEKIEEYLKQANCYGKYNYCFTVQPADTIGDAILMSFGAVGGAILGVKKSKGTIAYILNKNENGIGIIPIIRENKEERVDTLKLVFLNNDDINKVVIKKDGIGFKLIKIIMKDKSKFGFKTAKKIKNIDYHEINLNKFIESYK